MLTEKDFCDYDVQKSLMELGFPIVAQSYDLGNGLKEYLPKIHLYDSQKWLREEKDIIIRVIPIYDLSTPLKGMTYTYEIIYWEVGYVADECIEDYPTFEEAISEGIKDAVELLKEEK